MRRFLIFLLLLVTWPPMLLLGVLADIANWLSWTGLHWTERYRSWLADKLSDMEQDFNES